MTTLPLVFDAPKRGLPPRHLADLDEAGRREAVRALGLPAFRADQLARQYFARFVRDAAAMTDLPAAVRERVGAALLPPLLREVRHIETDAGTTRKTLWRLHDGTPVESVLMYYPGARRGDGVRVEPGRLRHGLPVLCDRPGRAAAQPLDGGDRRAGRRGGGVDGTRRADRRPGPAVQRGVHGHGGAAGELQPGARRPAPVDRPTAGRAGAVATRDHGLDRRPGARPSSGWPQRSSTSRSRFRCTPRTTSCATRWCR